MFALDEERDTFRVVLPPGAAVAHVDLARLRAPTVEEDLRLRDFTVNAVAAEVSRAPRAPLLVDPTGGAADCRRRLLRVCGPRSVADDPLRALRGVRLASGLGLAIAPQTLRLMAGARRALRRVSAERIRDELFRILQGPRPRFGCGLALRLGLLEAVGLATGGTPRLARLLRVDRVLAACGPRSAIRRGLAAPLEAGVTRLGVLRLAALLRDLGRERRAGAICGRLKLGVRAARICAAAVGRDTPRAWYRSPAAVPRDALRDLWACRDAGALEAIVLDAPSADSARRVWARYVSARRIFRRAPLLAGGTAMRELGIEAGPRLGRLLAETKRAQDLGRFRTRAGALRWARACLAREGLHGTGRPA